MSGEKLLPCWHCGGDAEVSYGVGDYDYDGGDRWRFYRARVTCRCGSELRVENDGDEYLPLERALDFAAESWNTRVAVTDRDFAMAVHDGRTWVCVEAAMESDALKPISGFTRDSIYVDSMREYGAWMRKAEALIRDMARELRDLNDGGIPTDCMEHERRMRELGIEVG